MIRVRPKSPVSYEIRGHVLLEERKFGDAIADFDRAIAIDPRRSDSMAQRGLALLRLHESERARQDFDAALLINSQNTNANFGRGLQACESGQFAEAIKAFTAALEVQPRFAAALRARAQAYRNMGDEVRASVDNTQVTGLAAKSTEKISLSDSCARQ
jgi:tetratricopeptide (TPR) repeat protein